MKVVFSKTADRQLNYWKKTDKKIFKRILTLIEAISKDPYQGSGLFIVLPLPRKPL